MKTKKAIRPEIEAVQKTAAVHGHIGWLEAEQCFVNLAGDYNYLEFPYYRSQDYENDGKPVHPTCKEMLDAYITPIMLEKLKKAGVAVPEYYISNGYFEPPVIIDPINPFMTKSRVVWKGPHSNTVAKSMTRNFTYAVSCQELPPGSSVHFVRAVLGWTNLVRFREIAEAVWRVLRVPVAKVRVVETAEKKLLLSDLLQLPFEKLNQRELTHIDRVVRWEK